jgi:uncharacterized protein YkwD
MFNKLFLFSLLIASFAISSFAQSNKLQDQMALRVTSGAESSDPFGWLETDDDADEKKRKKTSGVEASVVVNMGDAERRAFDRINKIRQEQGLAPLIWSDDLASVGRLHSQNMAEFRFFSHRGLDSKLVSDRADALKIGRWRSIGENIAFSRGYDDPVEKAIDLWLNSADHKRNMMDPSWHESAIGVARAQDGSVYFTQVFLSRK